MKCRRVGALPSSLIETNDMPSCSAEFVKGSFVWPRRSKQADRSLKTKGIGSGQKTPAYEGTESSRIQGRVWGMQFSRTWVMSVQGPTCTALIET